jgi:hypothetical protein
MRYLVAATILALAGCGDARGERTAWVGHPSVVLCADQAAIYAHAPGERWLQSGGAWQTIHGVYVASEDTVYLLCSDPDAKLTMPQVFYLVHELQHRADAKNGGNMWKLLQDESSPNGYGMGGYDFDCHHHR